MMQVKKEKKSSAYALIPNCIPLYIYMTNYSLSLNYELLTMMFIFAHYLHPCSIY